MILAVICLSVVFVITIGYYALMKKDLRSINRTLAAIRRSNSNAKVTTQTLDPDITRLANQINEILEEQKKGLLSAEKMSRDLQQAITNISHDLKTPLTSALGYVQMVISNKTPLEKRDEYLEIIEKRLESLSLLLDELFEFSRISEGTIEIHSEKLNVSNLLGDVLSLYYEDFTLKKIIPVVQFPEAPVYIFADGNVLKRIFQNLIQNALVHGAEFFSVTIEPGARLIFKNSMENVENIDANRLFERFYTADLSRSGKTTGLGLAICKELVEKLDGKITAKIEENSLVISIEIKEML